MNILFHVASGNKDRPERWGTIGLFFTSLALSFEKLGHSCFFICHSKAHRPTTFKKLLISDIVVRVPGFDPDYVFTWNGISEGDIDIVKMYGIEKIIFGELGFFNHYNTCYFDLSGTNYKSMNMVESLDDVIVDNSIFNYLVSSYKKERLYNNEYIFVPLQDESDTQITKLSPFKTMYELLEYVIGLYNYQDIKILYKKHPKMPCKVPSHHKLVEVYEDVHHYLPYAHKVIGINSSVLTETLLYHQRLLSVGLGLASRRFIDDEERKKFIINIYSKQLNVKDLNNVDIVKNSWIYKKLVTGNI